MGYLEKSMDLLLAASFLTLVGVSKKLYNEILTRGFCTPDKDGYLKKFNLGSELKILEEDWETRDRADRWAREAESKIYYIKAHDDVALYGKVYVQKKFTHKWAVVVHGYDGYGEQMNFISKEFYNMGYNVLVPDMRAHGKSQGPYITMGYMEGIDVLNWISKIVKGDRAAEIVLYGISMGASAVLIASGAKLPKNVKCIIEDCGYTSVSEEFKYHISKSLRLPRFPIYYIVDFICRRKHGYSLSKVSSLEQVKKCNIPIMFIHGAKDKFVPTEMVYKLYNAANGPKVLYISKEAGHGVTANIDKEKYFRRIGLFIEKYGEVS